LGVSELTKTAKKTAWSAGLDEIDDHMGTLVGLPLPVISFVGRLNFEPFAELPRHTGQQGQQKVER